MRSNRRDIGIPWYSGWGGAGVAAGLRAWQRGYGDYTGAYAAEQPVGSDDAFDRTPTAHMHRVRDQMAPESETATRGGSRKRGSCARRVSSRWRFAPRAI